MSDASLQPILALLGHPVAGNPTQYMIQKALDRCDLDWRYLTLDVVPEDLGDAVRGMRAMGFVGGNCAEPHKQAVIPHLDRTTEIAGLAGAVNLISRDENGLIGDNTEGKALLESLRSRIDPAGKRFVLLGAGRVARAIGLELAGAGVGEILVANRTESRAEELISLMTAKGVATAATAPWVGEYSVPPETDVVIQATSATEGDSDVPLALNLESLSEQTVVVDMTFAPPDTWLLREAAARDCRTLDGLTVLIQQTAINFQLWTSLEPDTTELREAVEEFLEL